MNSIHFFSWSFAHFKQKDMYKLKRESSKFLLYDYLILFDAKEENVLYDKNSSITEFLEFFCVMHHKFMRIFCP